MARPFVYATVYGTVLALFGGGAYLTATGAWTFGLFFFILGLLSLFLSAMIRKRILLTIKVLEHVAHVTSAYHGTIATSMLGSVSQMLITVVIAVTVPAVGMYWRRDGSDGELRTGLWIFLAFAFYWITQVPLLLLSEET